MLYKSINKNSYYFVIWFWPKKVCKIKIMQPIHEGNLIAHIIVIFGASLRGLWLLKYNDDACEGSLLRCKAPEVMKLIHVRVIVSYSLCAWGPLHTRDWKPVTNALQAHSLVEKAEPVQVRFTLRVRDQHSMWIQDGCRVDMDAYMASNGSCFIGTWTVFKNHLLEVGLTRNQETMALRTLTTVGLFYFIMFEDPHE